jgi:hypothetical protein
MNRSHRVGLPAIAAAAALAMVVSACSSGSSGSGSGSKGGGLTASAPGITATTITIGSHQPLTGVAAPGYSEIAPASNAYFQYVNDQGGVFGRKAGSAAGYHYSQALKSAGLTWSTDNLDQWLTDPKKFVPGARMPVRVLDTPSRRDLVAYLQKESQERNDRTGSNAPESNGEY